MPCRSFARCVRCNWSAPADAAPCANSPRCSCALAANGSSSSTLRRARKSRSRRRSEMDIVDRGRRVFRMEREALEQIEQGLGAPFEAAIELLAACTGRVIVAGVGKSGLIGRKIAATLTSTGTPAMFLHPVESVHGDLGIVGPSDVAILLSKSGATEELFPLLEQLRRLG